MLSLLLFPTLVWGLPGLLAVRLAFPAARGLERLMLALVLGMALVVPTAFGWSFLLRRSLSPEALLLVGGLWATALGAAVWWRRGREATAGAAPAGQAPGHRSRELALCATVLGLAAALTLLEAPRAVEATEVWAPCPHQSAFYLLEDGRGEGVESWDPQWRLRVTHFMEHALEPGYGMTKVLTYQRVGSTATLVQPVAFFGAGGFVVATLVYYLLVLGFSTLLAARGLATDPSGATEQNKKHSTWLAVLMGLVFTVGVRAIATYTVNENVLALGLSMATLWLVLRPLGALQAVLAGGVFALCLATRPMCVGLVPALIWYLFRHRQWRSGALFLAVLPLYAAAFLVAHHELFGVAVTDPSLFQVRTRHEFLGIEFTFHPLIWPFFREVVRSANEPFPLLIQLPLEHLRAFGVGFGLLVASGLMMARRSESLPAALWGIPGYALLLAIVSLDHHKLSYALTAVGALPWLAGLGGAQLIAGRGRLLVPAVALGIAAALFGATRLDFPLDDRRQYNDEVGAWSDPPIEEKTRRLTRPALWPAFEFDVATAGLAFDLLATARWAPRTPEEVPESPIFVWKQLSEIRTRFTGLPTPELLLPPYLGDLDGGIELTDSLAVFLLRLPMGPTGIVVSSDGQRLEVDVTTSPAAELGWLTVGLVDDGVENVREVELRIDSALTAPWFQTLQLGDSAPHLRVVSNAAIRLEPVENGDRLGFDVVEGEAAEAGCSEQQWHGTPVWSGAGGYRLESGPHRAALRISRAFPPGADPCRPPAPARSDGVNAGQ